MKARTVPAVPSGLSVRDVPSRSGNVYISFSTMSVVEPILRAKSVVTSKMGIRISTNPYKFAHRRATCSMNCHRGVTSGKISLTPLMPLILVRLSCVHGAQSRGPQRRARVQVNAPLFLRQAPSWRYSSQPPDILHRSTFMSSDRPLRRVIAVAPMPPEKSAYALARYSRSPDSIENSIKWVHGHSSEKFWEQFYFDYGHASIADLGHVIICFEEITELAAIRLEDEPVWDGQAKSSRYQNFASGGWYVPDAIHGSETEGTYQGILRSLGEIYRLLHGPLVAVLSEGEPRPEAGTPAEYQRTIAARAFDVTRYLLPLACRTNVGQVVSIRTLEKQITRLLSSQLPELRMIGEDLRDACQRPPMNVWGELCGQTAGLSEPMAPTLARHAKANQYQATVYTDLARYAKEALRGINLENPASWGAQEPVDLIEPHDPLDETVATLLYRVSQAPYRKL